MIIRVGSRIEVVERVRLVFHFLCLDFLILTFSVTGVQLLSNLFDSFESYQLVCHLQYQILDPVEKALVVILLTNVL